ncbi:hypothetical protein [Burkholderia gladioli]|uniref:hypothetical protein n=1 Tax=Burkholderia gladioli TaxID=28095 RepID=UPI001640C648|nr:hypothetical protein [Burkholderia gladioli]
MSASFSGPVGDPNIASDIRACHLRFLQAVRDARRGDHRAALALVERVRQRFGDEAADIQSSELQAYVVSDKPA